MVISYLLHWKLVIIYSHYAYLSTVLWCVYFPYSRNHHSIFYHWHCSYKVSSLYLHITYLILEKVYLSCTKSNFVIFIVFFYSWGFHTGIQQNKIWSTSISSFSFPVCPSPELHTSFSFWYLLNPVGDMHAWMWDNPLVHGRPTIGNVYSEPLRPTSSIDFQRCQFSWKFIYILCRWHFYTHSS